jgi:hypothetical protein
MSSETVAPTPVYVFAKDTVALMHDVLGKAHPNCPYAPQIAVYFGNESEHASPDSEQHFRNLCAFSEFFRRTMSDFAATFEARKPLPDHPVCQQEFEKHVHKLHDSHY